MHILKLASVLTIAPFVSACGDKPSPAGPTPPVASLVITGTDYVLTGSTTTYTATVTLSDGSTRTVMPSWSTTTADVATVDNAGRLAGRTHGSTTLAAAYEGRSASKTVQVVNNYGGSWSGRYIIRACKDSGIFTDGIGDDVPWCQGPTGIGGIGSKRSFAVTLVQTGRNYGEVRATFSPDQDWASGTTSGVVTADGRLDLEGTLKVLDWYGNPSWDLQLSGWDTNLDGFSGMTGRWAQNYTIPGQQERGSAHEEVELVTMSRSATASTSR
jgi:hypothetical protein